MPKTREPKLKLNKGQNQAMSTWRGQGYNSGMQTFTDKATGKVGRSGQMVSRRQRYYDIRVGLGLAGG